MNEERNSAIREDYKTMTLHELRDKYGISLTQLGRIIQGIKKSYAHPCNNKLWLQERLDRYMTAREMALEAGVPMGTMNAWIRVMRHGYKRKPKEVTQVVEWQDTQEWFSEQYEAQRKGIPTIARAIGRSFGFVSDRLLKYGIQRRTLGEAMAKFRERPSLEWCQTHYVKLSWSISKCATSLDMSFDTMLQTLREYGIGLRSASEQHQGTLNEFYEKTHPEEVKQICAEIGRIAGKEYWITGDVEAKKKLQSDISSEIWSNPEKRQKASVVIAELCQQGKCNAKAAPFVTKNGIVLLLKSSWEVAIATFLDSCDQVQNWWYEEEIIPYLFEDIVHNFIVDFKVQWRSGLYSLIECKNEHLLESPKEQAKIEALRDLESENLDTIVVSDKNQIAALLKPYQSLVRWEGSLFDVPLRYLESPTLQQEAMFHEILGKVCPWPSISYSEDELKADLRRLYTENLGAYQKDGLKATASNGGGMPGKKIITHFQPHFWDVAPKGKSPLPVAFGNKAIIKKCLDISRSENESLSFERLLREVNFHFSKFGRTSHFAPGFTRSVIRHLGMSGKRMFDPCCGWGGRLIGAFLERCSYGGCDISPETIAGLQRISGFLRYECNLRNSSCLEVEWSDCDFIFTSPPFYDVEEYIGGSQPWQTCGTRYDWLEKFVGGFVEKIGRRVAALYLDSKTRDDFESIRKFDEVISIAHRRHARRKIEHEYLCIYKI